MPFLLVLQLLKLVIIIIIIIIIVIITRVVPFNKLQNGIILLIFEILKIRNLGFVRNLILSNSCKFYFSDITVASFVKDKYGDVIVESIS